MCGIAGIFLTNRSELRRVVEADLSRMADAMAHRGPDDAGKCVIAGGTVGFGFRRLAILDLSANGQQPMSNEGGTVWLVYNGEIYNHLEHRTALQQAGHRFKGHCDTETLLHLYEERGLAAVSVLRGMFAFAIWDDTSQLLHLVRDRVGVKPLYYYHRDGVFAFASEIRALLTLPFVRRALNYEAFYHFLTFGASPAPHTLFEDISKLGNGSRLTVDRDGNVRTDQYWDAAVATHQTRYSANEAADSVRDLLQQSVRMRLASDVPLGVFLSGGLDSTTNLSMVASEANLPVETFSVGFAQQGAYDELAIARESAAHYHANHHEVSITSSDFLRYLPQSVVDLEEPIFQPVSVPQYFLSRLMQNAHVTVAHVGEGSDELFGGYPWYRPAIDKEATAERVRKHVPKWLLELGYSCIGPLARHPTVSKRRELLRRLATAEPMFLGSTVVFSEFAKRLIIDQAFFDAHPSIYSPDIISGYHAQQRTKMMAPIHPIDRIIYTEFRLRLPELLLQRVDRVTMACSVEGRTPFLDHVLIEFVLGLPPELRYDGITSKPLLHRAVQNLVPQQVLNRPKQGFSVPIAEWLISPHWDLVRDTIMSGGLVKSGFFSRDHLRSFLQLAKLEATSAAMGQLYLLFTVSLWYRYWFEGQNNPGVLEAAEGRSTQA